MTDPVIYRFNRIGFNENNMKEQERNNLKRLLWLSNVYQFFPDRSISDLQQGYQRWLHQKQQFKAQYRQINLDQLQQESSIHDFDAGILLTFHYGPYRLLPRYLLAMGYQVTLLLSTDVWNGKISSIKKNWMPMGSVQIVWSAWMRMIHWYCARSVGL